MLKSLFVVLALLLSTPALAHGGHGPHNKVVKKRVIVKKQHRHYRPHHRTVAHAHRHGYHYRVWVPGFYRAGVWVRGYWVWRPGHASCNQVVHYHR